MNIPKLIKRLLFTKNEHFLAVDGKTYKKYKYLIKLAILLNKDYKFCEIRRKKYKKLNNFVVVGLKYSGKNVKRRTSGYAKDFLDNHENSKCLYCEEALTYENATADHIIPISSGGNNTQVNLIVCCKRCNSERGNTKFVDYLIYRNVKYINKLYI